MNPLDDYNPEDYDEDTIEVDDGWRCLVIMETMPGYKLPDDLQYYDDDDEIWRDSSGAGTGWLAGYAGITYRTQADVPKPSMAATFPITAPDDLLALILKMTQ